MIVSGMRLINARRLDLQARRDGYVKSALKAGITWEKAQEIGDAVVPKSEFEYLDQLQRTQAKSESFTGTFFVSLLITLVVGFLSLWLWG